jgi:hypothetical protein
LKNAQTCLPGAQGGTVNSTESLDLQHLNKNPAGDPKWIAGGIF